MDDETRAKGAACCPLPPGVSPLPLIPGGEDEKRLDLLSRRARALSDPIRLRMLGLMVKAEACCRPAAGAGSLAGEPSAGAASAAPGSASEREPAGVCVCELQAMQGLAQSKVSYHLKVLRDAGLVREERRGKWSFYSIDEKVAGDFATGVRRHLGV